MSRGFASAAAVAEVGRACLCNLFTGRERQGRGVARSLHFVQQGGLKGRLFFGAAARGPYASIRAMELNQIKRFIKDLEERTDSLRRYL